MDPLPPHSFISGQDLLWSCKSNNLATIMLAWFSLLLGLQRTLISRIHFSLWLLAIIHTNPCYRLRPASPVIWHMEHERQRLMGSVQPRLPSGVLHHEQRSPHNNNQWEAGFSGTWGRLSHLRGFFLCKQISLYMLSHVPPCHTCLLTGRYNSN